MKKYNLIKNQSGIAWLTIFIIVALVAPPVIGGAVWYNDNAIRSEARKYQQPAESKQLLKEKLNDFFNIYRKNCFSRVASIGNRQVYQKALDDIILAYNPSKTTDSFAEYRAGTIFTKKPIMNVNWNNDNERLEVQKTIWHELTHHLEVENGDRLGSSLNPNRKRVQMRGERHAEYMEKILGILPLLMTLEKDAKNKKVKAEQIKAKIKLIEKQFKEGSANTYEAVPSDLEDFAKYTGFQVDLQKILDLYKKGTCLKFPDGVFTETGKEDETASGEAGDENKYVVFEGTNATVGIIIATKKQYETEEPASNYSGGGLDPNYILEKKLLSGEQTFAIFTEAEKWLCDQLTEIIYAPLGIGWTAKYQGRSIFLGNTSCGK